MSKTKIPHDISSQKVNIHTCTHQLAYDNTLPFPLLYRY